MTMTPEEKFNQDVWWVLRAIRREVLTQAYGKIIVIKIDLADLINKNPNPPSISDIRHIVRNKMEKEWKVLEIVEKRSKDEGYGLEFNWNNTTYFLVEINRKKFDEVYEKYKKACDLTSYLNNYQEKMVKGEDLPPDDLNKLANVLHDIKQLAFYAKDGDSVVYPSDEDLATPLTEHRILSDEKRFFVFAIQDEGAVKVIYEHKFGKREKPYRWTLEVDKPKLRELESKVMQLYIDNSKGVTLNISNLEPEKADIVVPDLESSSEEIDQWLASKSERTIGRMWRLIRALNYEWELRDQDRFPVPLDKFEREKISNANDQKIILTSLHNKKFISVSRKVGETPPSDDPNKPSGSLWEPITDDPEIIYDAKTQVEIFPLKFKQLVSQLKELTTKKEVNEAEIQEHTKQSTEETKSPLATDEIEWPKEFQWGSNGRSFLLGDGKELKFGADKSDRKDIFESIANEKGGWTLIGTMAKDIGKSEGNVRTVINQLNKKIVSQGLQRYILIEPRGQTNKPGAYRLVPFPQGVKHH